MGAFLVRMANLGIEGLGAVMVVLLGLLPDSPFSEPSLPPDSINLGWITWLFDFPTWIVHFTAVLTAIGIYYLIRVVARWLKVARG